MTLTKDFASDRAALFARAQEVTRAARRGVSRHLVRAELSRLLDGFEARLKGAPQPRQARRSLDRWARELEAKHYLIAEVHLERAAAALGLRREGEACAEPHPAPAKAPRTQPAEASRAQAAEAAKPRARRRAGSAPTKPRPGASAAEAADEGPWAVLSPRERALVARLPGPDAPLQGAAALAACWGGGMSPTSARGRYSRLANKLRAAHGRDLLLRGQGRYGRAVD
ncbi:MAG: hypothetical protein D6731_13390 [Planctomycetota bacterium]|nr:MAG: hypothetical protein D6731_13390 [Planctomycetota bacterium]